MSVPATPNVEEIKAAETAASALAATWVKLGRDACGEAARESAGNQDLLTP